MRTEEKIRQEYISLVKSIQSNKDYSSWKLGYAAALENILELKEDDWKKMIKE